MEAKSHWNYRVFKYKDDLTIREVHYDEDGNPTSYSSEPALLHGDTLLELGESLEKMGRAIYQAHIGGEILTEESFNG